MAPPKPKTNGIPMQEAVRPSVRPSVRRDATGVGEEVVGVGLSALNLKKNKMAGTMA
jgi:hypothetical protein